MPRTLPGGFLSSLTGPVLEFSTLIKLSRVDGVVFGFTDSDIPITYAGTTYQPSDGISATNVATATGTGVDNLEGVGFLSSTRIKEADIVAGLFDNATVEVRIYDRTSSTATAPIMSGYIGELTVVDGIFKAEFRSLTSRLKMTLGDVTSINCRARVLGDCQCKFNLTSTVFGCASQSSRTVSSASGTNMTFASDPAPTFFYKYGLVTFTTGPNAGISREVKTHVLTSGNAVIEVRTAFPFVVSVGDVATLTIGCDRTIDACRNKFNNAVNFHGEPFLPGNAQMTTIGRPHG